MWQGYGEGVVRVQGFDHLVLRCHDVDKTLAWYVDELGLEPERVEEWRAGSAPFPSARIDAGTIIDLIPGGPDGIVDGRLDHICLVVDADSVERVASPDSGFEVLAGPVPRYGARGMATSVYIRDPDGLMVELRSYPSA